jgi:hypothetical protein
MTTTYRLEIPPARLSGRRIKAGFHCHTVHSDGGLSVQETAARYRAQGFDCLGITDHRQVTPAKNLSDKEFLLIDATENGGDPDLIGVGVEAAVPRELSLAERARRLAGQGGFTIAAHPTYGGVLPSAYVDCPALAAMEIYNAYCEAAYANGYALELWDMVLGQGKRIWGVAGDDAHLNPRKRHYSDAGLGWVEIWTDSLAEEPVLNALQCGAFFSTQGPVFEAIEVDEGALRLQCSPVRQIRWRTWGKVGWVDDAPEGSCLTQSSLPDWFHPTTFVRLELVDSQGKRAWSNPIFVNQGVQGA